MKSTELYELIHSLNRSEKKYFRAFSDQYPGKTKKEYLILFDLLEKSKIYDEEKVKKVMGKHVNFPSLKNYLYQIILKSQRNYHSESSITMEIIDNLKDIEILYHKSLFQQCYRIIKKTKKLCLNYNETEYLQKVLYWEKQLIYRWGYDKISEDDFDQIQVLEKQSRQDALNTTSYFDLLIKFDYTRVAHRLYHSEEQTLKLSEYAKNPLIKNRSECKTDLAKIYKYLLLASYNDVKGLRKDEIKANLKCIEVFNSNPKLRDKEIYLYMVILFNTAGTFLKMKDFVPAMKYIQLGASLKSKSELFSAVQFERKWAAMHAYFMMRTEFEDALEAVQSFIPELQKHEHVFTKHVIVFLNYYIIITYLCNGLYKESLPFINHILGTKTKHTQDIGFAVQILYLIVHYELNNITHMEFFARSAKGKLTKNKPFFAFEKLMLDFFGKHIPKAESGKERLKLFDRLKTDLEQLQKDPKENPPFTYFDYFAWIDSKLSNQTLKEVMRLKHRI